MKRGSKRKAAPEDAAEAPPGPLCRRCQAPAVASCAYEDRRGTSCATDWCADHVVEFGGLTFCQRHAGTVQALGEQGLDRGVVPETDNRIPSLLAMVAAALDADIRTTLEQRRTEAGGEQLIETPVSLITTRGRSVQRRWERTWKLAGHTGITHSVSLWITEEAPLEVILRIDGTVLAHAVPSWVSHRGVPDRMAGEAVQRERFFGLLRTQITTALPALTAEQQEPRRRPWWMVPGLRRNTGT